MDMTWLFKFRHFLTKNSPTIFTFAAVGGVISVAVLAITATPKALRLISDEKMIRADGPNVDFHEITKMEAVKIVWKCYIPTVIMGGITIGCIIGANSINLRRNAALASIYSLTEATLREYQAKIVETIGENKARKISDEVYKDTLAAHPVDDKTIIITNRGDTLCYEALSGRYFKSDIENIRRVQNDINRDLLSEMYISLNDVYFSLGLANTIMGETLGWYVNDGSLDFRFTSQLTAEGEPCLVIDYKTYPRNDYRNR